jgi:hypothetical protein
MSGSRASNVALIEIDDGELQRLRAAADPVTVAKARLLDAVGANPDHRMSLLKGIKAVSPQTPIPELDHPAVKQVDALSTQLTELQKSIAKDKADAAQQAREAAIGSKIANGEQFLRQRGYTQEGVEAVAKFMTEKGITDFEVAEAAWSKMNPPEDPVAPTAFGRHMPLAGEGDNETLRNILKSGHPKTITGPLNQWASKTAMETLAELRGGRR